MKKTLSLLVALMMILSIFSLTAMADTSVELNLKLADLGELYIEGDQLPQTAQVPDSDEVFALTYTCDKPGIIDADGNVIHGADFQYVKVSASGTYDGTTYQTATQSLLVLPDKALVNENFFEDFEDYETGALDKNTIGNDWTITNQSSTYNKIEILSGDSGKYLNFETIATGGSGNPKITRTVDFPDSGKLFVGFRANIDYTTGSTANGVMVGSFIFNNGSTKSMVTGITGGFDVNYKISKKWHNIWYEINRVNNGGTNLYAATLYVDGNLVGTGNIKGTEFRLQIMRSYIQGAEIDDIIILDYAPPYIIDNVNIEESKLTSFSVVASQTIAEDDESKAYVALYDEDKKLLNVSVKEDIGLSGETSFNDLNMDVSEAKYIKIYVWTKNTLIPMANVFEYIG